LLAIALAIGALIAHVLSCGFFGHKCGLSVEDSATAAVLLLPLGEFVVIISTAAVKVLQGTEKFVISPLAFLLILITVVAFQPFYNNRKKLEKIIEKFPVNRKISESTLVPTTTETTKNFQSLAINVFVVLCLAAITIILYEQLPVFGVPIPYGRPGTAILAFVFFSSVPFWNSVKAIKRLWREVNKKNTA
jgi:Kef-type K+ transport system membrane component KefB